MGEWREEWNNTLKTVYYYNVVSGACSMKCPARLEGEGGEQRGGEGERGGEREREFSLQERGRDSLYKLEGEMGSDGGRQGNGDRGRGGGRFILRDAVREGGRDSGGSEREVL